MKAQRLYLRFGILLCAVVFFTSCDAPSGSRLTVAQDIVRFEALAYPEGNWSATVSGFEPHAQPADSLSWTIRYAMKGDRPDLVMERIKGIRIAFAARRMNDGNGRYKNQNAYFSSSYLTPSGLPIEGFQYFIANSKVGGPYKTPLDQVHDLDLSQVIVTDDSLSFQVDTTLKIIDDFPPGLYRIELAFFASIDDVWMPLHMVRALDESFYGCTIDYEQVFYKRFFMPPIRIGNPKQPRAIWTLFTSTPNHGIAGIVSNEDAPYFAITSRVKLPTRYLLPCTPDRSKCVFRIVPDMPTVQIDRYLNPLLEPDAEKGEMSVQVTKPNGARVDLGTHSFNAPSFFDDDVPLLATPSDRLDFDFDQFGKYSIRMTGHLFDRFNNRYEAGGTYEVWVAYPLTFATGIKPGTPMRVGQSYSPSANINPPVRANVQATVSLFRADDPANPTQTIYKGTAQKFGYFFPDPRRPLVPFDAPGEYLFDLFATYTDPQGKFYMGHMKNASIVYEDTPNMNVRGIPGHYEDRNHDMQSYTLEGDLNLLGSGTLNFPYRSGDLIHFAGNGPETQGIQPAVTVDEPTGDLQNILNEHFPPTMINLCPTQGRTIDPHKIPNVFPGPKEQIKYYMLEPGAGKSLPLMSTTSKGYSPFEYPELTDRTGYFYIASSRPGFPVFFTVADSTIAENYWLNSYVDYSGTVGAAKRGDQPGDIYWSLVLGQFSDRNTGRYFAGIYSAGGVAEYRGADTTTHSRPFEKPIAIINGVALDIYAGVGPAPGAMFETGAIKGVGSITVPMVPHNANIQIVKPNGTEHSCVGRADRIGNFVCPNGPLEFDQPGVYRVFSKFEQSGATGTCVGAAGGWYSVYAVEKGSRYSVKFDAMPHRPIPYDRPLVIRGRVDPALEKGRIHYSIVTPGILIDEGTRPLSDGRFELKLYPDQIGAQFPNVLDHPGISPQPFVYPYEKALSAKSYLHSLFMGTTKRVLSDTIEITVFVQGKDAQGNPATAGGKMILRGNRALVPYAFRDSGKSKHEK